mmetsp:Transcript_9898/g.23638  ORF Transcript_9898/g.23638 Transcript_9898/m.23638 type:complete len:235 (-) Transcript_9898:422-1126(-)
MVVPRQPASAAGPAHVPVRWSGAQGDQRGVLGLRHAGEGAGGRDPGGRGRVQAVGQDVLRRPGRLDGALASADEEGGHRPDDGARLRVGGDVPDLPRPAEAGRVDEGGGEAPLLEVPRPPRPEPRPAVLVARRCQWRRAAQCGPLQGLRAGSAQGQGRWLPGHLLRHRDDQGRDGARARDRECLRRVQGQRPARHGDDEPQCAVRRRLGGLQARIRRQLGEERPHRHLQPAALL